MVSPKAPTITGISGLATLIFTGFMTWYGFPKVINMKLKEAVSMENGTESFEFWREAPFVVRFSVCIFHVTNPEQMQNGDKPILKEKGPYVYDMHLTREEIELDPDKDVVKYKMKKTFYFNKEESGCYSQDDQVTVLNAALVGTVLMVKSLVPTALPIVAKAIPFLFPGTKDIFSRVKVRDLLFDGILIDCSSSEAEFICQSIESTAPETIRKHENNRDFLFSFFHHLNDSGKGPYIAGMGMKNTSRGQLFEYLEEPNVPGEIWNTPYCNMLNGSDGTVFAPLPLNSPPKKRIYNFISDICRSVYVELEFSGKTFDIPVHHYAIPERIFRASQEIKCFCPIVDDKPKCSPPGTFDIQACMNSPTVFSWPHFYQADESLLEYALGVNPEKEKHETYLELEPMTGTPVKGSKKAQINLPLQRIETFDLLANITPGLLPIFWMEEFLELPPFLQTKLTDAYKALKLVDYVKYGLAGSGFVLLVASAFLLAHRDRILCFSASKVNNYPDRLMDSPRSDHRPPLSASINDFNIHHNGSFSRLNARNNAINGWKGEQFLN